MPEALTNATADDWIPINVARRMLRSTRTGGLLSLEAIYRWTNTGKLSYQDRPGPNRKPCRWVRRSEIEEMLTPICTVERSSVMTGADIIAEARRQREHEADIDRRLREFGVRR